MAKKHGLTDRQLDAIRSALPYSSLRELARQYGKSPSTIARLKAELQGPEVPWQDIRRRSAPTAPSQRGERTCWDLESIRAARDSLLRGDFALPARLSAVIATDDALFTARRYRCSPQFALRTQLTAGSQVRAKALARRVAAAAEQHVLMPDTERAAITLDMVDCGVGVGVIRREALPDGSLIRARLEHWPIEHVKWDRYRGRLTTRTESGATEDITHGDGTWVVASKYREGWKREACLLPAAFIWAAHAEGLQDWNQSSRAHGLAKLIGQLPEGVSLLSDSGEMSAEGEAFLDALVRLVTGADPAGVIPAGAKAEFAANPSGAWQVFKELLENRERAAARAYLGTDAYLGSASNAPGVDISELFSVASTILQTDLTALETAFSSGVYLPWTVWNYGDPALSPTYHYLAPDPDAERRSQQEHERSLRLYTELERHRSNGLLIDQELVDALALKHGVNPVPELQADPGTGAPPGADA